MKPQLPSRVPVVLDKLIELFDAATTDVQIIDGPPVGGESTLGADVLIIAHGTPDEPGVTTEMDLQTSLGRTSYVERVSTTVVISSYSGDTNMKARRDRAAVILAAVKDSLDDNQVVAAVWDKAYLGENMLWYPVQTTEGASCAVGFRVVTESII